MSHNNADFPSRWIPEEQLLLHCSRARIRECAIRQAAALLRQPLDWQYVLEVAIRHGVAPLLHHGLRQTAPQQELEALIPNAVLHELRCLYEGNLARNRRLYRVIGEVVKAFDRAGVEAMGLKDLQLAWEVYPDLGLRPMGDVDMLIHERDYEVVARCMHELGFAPLPDADIPATRKYGCGHHFRRSSDNVWIDLQWNVMQREWDVYQEGHFTFDVTSLWAGAVPLRIDDYQLLAPRPEDMLFHLCLHLEGHQYCELVLFCDIAEFLRYYADKIDWAYFVQLAKSYRAEASVYYVLLLAQRLFQCPLPARLFKDLTPRYFSANLHGPLFGNLAELHGTLDDLRLTSAPPAAVMSTLEARVRRQTAAAMQVYQEVDGIAHGFFDGGGALLIPFGEASETVFPDPALRPFEEVALLIREDDLPRLLKVLSARGFQAQAEGPATIYVKDWRHETKDPALARLPVCLTARVNVETDVERLLGQAYGNTTTKKNMAYKILKGKLNGKSMDVEKIPVEMQVMALPPEAALLWLAVRLGERQQDRLFHLCSLLEFFRSCERSLDWRRVVELAQRYRVTASVFEALAMLSAVMDVGSFPASLVGNEAETVQPRVLEWARYGPADLTRRSDLKRVFYDLFTCLVIEGSWAKCHYLLRSFVRRGKAPALPVVLLKLMASAITGARKQPLTTRDFAYWIESQTT